MEVILVFFEELEDSAVGLTVSVGRNDYKGYKLFCNGFFHEWHYLSHPRASAARPWDLFDCRVKPDNDRKRRKSPSGLSRGSKDTRHGLTICTQKAARFNKGSCRSRCCGQAGYSLRASTKVHAAAGVAVKLATACHCRTYFSSPLSLPCSFLLLCHSRAWHGNL